MKALLMEEYKKLDYTDIDVPTVAADEVLVRVSACGICGSDVHGYDGSTGRRLPPLVMGHEAAGVITEVGSDVADYAVGDRVTFDSTVYCGSCRFCERGEFNLCDNRMVLGVSCNEFRRYGAFAEFVNVPSRILYRVPEELPLEHAAMVEPVSVAVHAVHLTQAGKGDSVVVIGAGMIGLLVVQALRAAGVDDVTAVDVVDDKLTLAKELGATRVISGKTEDVAQILRDATNGEGVTAAIEVVGASATITTAIESVRKGGTVTLVGNLSPSVDIPLQAVVSRQLKLQGSCASNGEYGECIELMASQAIKVAPLISKLAPLEEGQSWFDRLYAGEDGLMKVMLQP